MSKPRINDISYISQLKIQTKLFGGWSGIIITMCLFLIVTSAAEAGFHLYFDFGHLIGQIFDQ